MKLQGRGAVVTGGGRGIGAEIARALAAAGARVVVAARTRGEVEKVAGEIGGFALTCDVTDPKSIGEMACAASGRLGAVDILVNNAGIAASAPLQKQTLEDWNRMLAVNATGPFLCAKMLMPGMLERKWGRVVNVASVAGLTGARYIAAYSASKHALVGFTRSLAEEVAGTGVTVNAVCPAYVETDMARLAVGTAMSRKGLTEEQARAAVLATTGQARFLQPEEVAGAVVEICAGDTNGQVIVLDGKA